MANRILLKNIFIEKFYASKEVDTILPTISLTENEQFWDGLEKEAKIKIPKPIIEKTNCACWTCSLLFDEKPTNIPIFLFKDIVKTAIETPTNYVENTSYENMPYHVLLDSVSRVEKLNVKYYGNFCTIFCARRYLEETVEIPQACKEHYRNMLYMLYSQEIGRDVSYIPLSYPKTLMNVYIEKGISEQEYKTLNNTLYKCIV